MPSLLRLHKSRYPERIDISGDSNRGTMGRAHKVTELTPEQQAKVTGTIRRYQYEHVDLIRSDLAAGGIKIARSTLYRHVQNLKKSDLGTNGVTGSTLVITIDLSSGGSTQIRTSASPSLVISAVGALDSAGAKNGR